MKLELAKCPRCKGWHRKGGHCAVQAKIASQRKFNRSAKQDFFGESPNVFVGRFGYPNVNVGVLSVEEYTEHDNPLKWSAEDKRIQQIIDLRTQLVNANFRTSIRSFNDKLLSMCQEVSLSQKPVDIEVNLNKKPHFSLTANQDIMPHGPNVKVKKAKITENPKIPKKVDRLVSDSDVKASTAVKELYKSGLDEHYLTKVLSVGNLGIGSQRKLVPTRWSITAVDDTLGKQLIDEVKQYPESDHLAFFGGYLGNFYVILLFPNIWGYELFETFAPQSGDVSYMSDHELYEGRKSYAQNTAGGYYAARLSILEGLKKMKRQSSVLALRFITSDYWAPLGVWVVREAARKAMAAKPIEFESKELMIRYASALVKKKYTMDADVFLRASVLLKEQKTQMRLRQFLA